MINSNYIRIVQWSLESVISIRLTYRNRKLRVTPLYHSLPLSLPPTLRLSTCYPPIQQPALLLIFHLEATRKIIMFTFIVLIEDFSCFRIVELYPK